MHLAAYGGPYAGSFIPMLRGVADEALKRGWTVDFVFGRGAGGRPWIDELRQSGHRVQVITGASRRDATKVISGLLDEDEVPTLLHTHFTRFDVAAAVVGGRRRRTALFWHVHTPQPHRGVVQRMRNRVKFSLVGRRTAGILCASPDIAETVIASGAPADRVTFVHNAVDTERFPLISADERRAARDELRLAGATVLLHFGWDWERKGGDLFLEAIAALRRDTPDIVGLTVGGGAAAREYARRIGLGDDSLRVAEPDQDVARLYAAADVFMAPSRAEGTPYSVMEALSSGTPVVASAIPGHETLGRSVAGCMVCALEPDALVRAVRELLNREPDRAIADARAGHEWLSHNLDVRPWSRSLIDRYQRALDVAPG
jgi:glycosyltransferase involved in cell wall biosynthesis